MPFDEADLDTMLEALGAKDVIVRLNGAPVKTIQGVYRRRTEMASPYESQTLVIVPSVLCKQSDLADVDRSHTLTTNNTLYKIYGDFEPLNSGLSRVGLVKA